jgi:hypothetical protein
MRARSSPPRRTTMNRFSVRTRWKKSVRSRRRVVAVVAAGVHAGIPT